MFSCTRFLVSKKNALQVLPALPQVASLAPLLQVALLVLLLLLPRPAPLLVPLLPRPAPFGFHTQRHPIAANLLTSLYNRHTWLATAERTQTYFMVWFHDLWLWTSSMQIQCALAIYCQFSSIQICSHKHHTADCQIWLRHADKTSLILWQKIWILSWIGPPEG